MVLDSVFTSLVNIAFFGLDPSEIPVFNMCFDTALPSPEEFVKGKLINIECVSCLEKYPEISIYIGEAVSALKPSMVQKCFWGRSTYGDCYVDPSVVRDYLRSTMLKVFKVPRFGDTQKRIHDSFIENLEMMPEPMKAGWEMSNYIFEAKLRDAWWDYAWWDYSYWAEEVTHITNYEDKPIPANPEHPMDVAGDAFWDLAVWDYSYWAEETHSTPEGIEMLERFGKLHNAVMKIADKILFEQKSRLLTMPLIVANYQTAEEREKWPVSRRVDEFAYTKSWVYKIRDAVRGVVGGAPPAVFRVYESAAMSLVSRLGRAGGWGYEAFRGMDLSALRKQWIDEWSAKGLDPEALGKIFDTIIDLVNEFARVRFRQGMLREILYSGLK
ncbi:MAG: hypothetical protein LM583_10570, partial [Desulfurococcaceae archaeon]|nr:hypothetical protein [Desulfurococcaceae archaeon]